MKIINCQIQSFFLIETDSIIYPYYRRISKDIWENLMGGSWEPVFDTEELEQLFNKIEKET